MDLARQSLAILLVFALLWAGLWVLRRRGMLQVRGPSCARGPLESSGKLLLTAQHSVHLVRVADRNLVLAVHPGGITLLCDSAAASTTPLRGPVAS